MMTVQPPPYNPNVPQGPKETISQGQIDFLNNFSSLYNIFQKNHVSLDATSGAGNHTVIQLPQQSSQFQTDIGEISVYTREVNGQGIQTFLRYQGNQTEFQFSNYQIYSIQRTALQTFYFTFLPGRVLVYFGSIFVNPSKFEIGVLELLPPIAKYIITMNFCTISGTNATSFYPPTVTLNTPQNGIYKSINLFSPLGPVGSKPATEYHYIVMANI